ncbi:Protein of unknown function [Cotesia congregata]|uniref:Uncharacterized protein n=1 Tax=Cotesia congregata TaxID=51543 RepID=A0A8J2E2G2_COTCN|nr:Protein of unknown function [Cotesia congregata]
MMYTYNPFTNYAPHPWKEIEVTEKPNSRWTLYNLRFTNEKEACHVIEFDKTKLLNGYTIKISASDRYYNSKFVYLKNSNSVLKTGARDMNLYLSSLKNIKKYKVSAIPVYFEIPFLIATQYRNNSQPPQINSVIDSYTGMIMIVSLLSLITVIVLINKYQFGGAFRDVYLLLLDMEVLLPLNRCFSRVVFLSAFLFAFVFSPLLEGQFFALLAKPTYRNVENLKDLYEYKYQVRFFLNVYKDILDTGLWTTDQDIKYLHKNKKGNFHGCLKLAHKESSTACIDAAEFILKNAPKFKLHISKEVLFPSYYVHITRADWPLKDRVGKKIVQAFEAGFNYYNNRTFILDQLKKMKAVEKVAEFEKYDIW